MASPPFRVPVLLVDKVIAAPVVTVDKPSKFDRLAYPSNCGKKQRSVWLFSIVAAVSTGAQQAECLGLVFHKFLTACCPLGLSDFPEGAVRFR